jgi:hypothetical protein
MANDPYFDDKPRRTMQDIRLVAGVTPDGAVVPVKVAADGTPLPPTATTPVSGSVNVASLANVIPGVGATNLGKAEDAIAASGDTGVAMFGVRAPAVPTQKTSAAGDYGTIEIDAEGKQTVNTNAGPEATWQTVVDLTVATVVAAKGAVTGLRIYVTDVTVSNTSATPVTFYILDGATIIWKKTIKAGETFSQTFNTALRGTVATQLGIQSSVAATTIATCLGGYVGL